jgi:hypothetical protein
MTTPHRTNPAYAMLAYRRSILQHVSAMLMREYYATPNEEPKQRMYSDEVFRCDAEVPVTEIAAYIEELQLEDARIGLELNKFEFRAQEPPPPALMPVLVPAQCVAPTRKDEANASAQPQGTPLASSTIPPPSTKAGSGKKQPS